MIVALDLSETGTVFLANTFPVEASTTSASRVAAPGTSVPLPVPLLDATKFAVYTHVPVGSEPTPPQLTNAALARRTAVPWMMLLTTSTNGRVAPGLLIVTEYRTAEPPMTAVSAARLNAVTVTEAGTSVTGTLRAFQTASVESRRSSSNVAAPGTKFPPLAFDAESSNESCRN